MMLKSINGPYPRNCDFDCRFAAGHYDDTSAGAVESLRALTAVDRESGGLPLWSVHGQGTGVLIFDVGRLGSLSADQHVGDGPDASGGGAGPVVHTRS